MEPKVTVIVPAYNAAKTIDKCLISLKKQTLVDDYQVIIINDGSQDKTVEVIKKIISNDKRFRIISKENTGLSNTRNFGMNYVDTEYVTFVDADDYVEANYIEELLRGYHKKNCDLSIVGYQKEREDGSIVFKSKDTLFNMNPDEAMHEIFISGGFEGYTWNKLYRTSIFRKYNLQFNKTSEPLEDLYFDLIYFKYCRRITYNNSTVYHYVMHANSIVNSTKIGTKFDTNIANTLNILESMRQLIPSNIKIQRALEAKICWTAVSIIRTIYASHDQNNVEKSLLVELKMISKKYSKSFMTNDIFPRRDKAIYVLNSLSPSLFAWLWNTLGLHGMG